MGTSGTRENQVNGTSVAEHTTTLHQVDSKNVGEAKAVVILKPNPKAKNCYLQVFFDRLSFCKENVPKKHKEDQFFENPLNI